MTDEEKLTRARTVDAAIRAHYLSLPGKTEAGWVEVLIDPRKYNIIWRHMLKYACGQSDLDINRFPPPLHLILVLPPENRAHAAE